MKKIIQWAAVGLAIAAGAAIGFKLATDSELRGSIMRTAQDAIHTSKKQVGMVSEEVAVRTAKMTKNPKINQDWVEKQWESIGY